MTQQILNLNIGELIVTDQNISILSTLGSCISVCLYSPETNSGGIIHYALPKKNQSENPLRYGDYAINKLIEELENFTHYPRNSFKAKIVGGSSNLRVISKKSSDNNIGKENINIAFELLNKNGIEIISSESGGDYGRKIIFYPKDGRLQCALIYRNLDGVPNNKELKLKNKLTIKTELPKESQNKNNQNLQNEKRIKVLIVDDSKTIRQILLSILEQDKEIEVIGQAENPQKAEIFLKKIKPDVITLDMQMPYMTGVEWLEKLIPRYPIPVIMITSMQLQEGNEVFKALELGAVDYIQKPEFNQIETLGKTIVEKIKDASRAKVRTLIKKKHINQFSDRKIIYKSGLVLAIGASTGGTEALREILVGMPITIPPTIIVQHIPPIFSKAFSDRLNDLCPFEVKEAENGDQLRSNRVLIAPGGKQTKLILKNSELYTQISDDPPMNRHKPSVDYLFNSVASLVGKKAIGIILTGMGADGAKGLLNMKNAGAYTISQDESTSVVYGMPKAAFEIGACNEVLSLDLIAEKIVTLGKLDLAA